MQQKPDLKCTISIGVLAPVIYKAKKCLRGGSNEIADSFGKGHTARGDDYT
jgi:hypothetical protein